jgi:aminopeptidase N
VGDRVFFKILKRWAQKREGDNVTTDEFIALAEKASGEELDELFETWLFTPGRPELSEPLGAEAARTSAAAAAGAIRLRPHGRLRR